MNYLLEPEDVLLPDEPEEQETDCRWYNSCRPIYQPMYGIDI